mmetsp:Transcript_87111/g.219336  ORF Transcript_87111/g.219336 Transcript_87111/m.219336 type:complete len:229 (-) Transcript_87111:1164-1850(-)
MRLRRSFCRICECNPRTSTLRLGALPLACAIRTFDITLEALGLSRSRAKTDERRETEDIALTKSTTRPPDAVSAAAFSRSMTAVAIAKADAGPPAAAFQRYRRKSHIAKMASRSLSSLHTASTNCKRSGNRVPAFRCISAVLAVPFAESTLPLLPPGGIPSRVPLPPTAELLLSTLRFVRSTMCTARVSRNLNRSMRAPTLPPSSSPCFLRCQVERGSRVRVAEKTKV